MTTHLVAFAEGLVMGTVTQSKGGRLTFLYSDQWLASSGAYPLSVSIPLASGQQGQRKIEPFLWGLLPDNEIYLANGPVSSMFRPETFSDSLKRRRRLRGRGTVRAAGTARRRSIRSAARSPVAISAWRIHLIKNSGTTAAPASAAGKDAPQRKGSTHCVHCIDIVDTSLNP